jgi:transposase
MRITYGYSKAHRPALKQVVLELLGSQDGGGPLGSKSGEGNTSDTQIFKERAAVLRAAFARSPTPPYRVAEARLYTEDTAATRATRGFIPRMPGPRKLVSPVST